MPGLYETVLEQQEKERALAMSNFEKLWGKGSKQLEDLLGSQGIFVSGATGEYLNQLREQLATPIAQMEASFAGQRTAIRERQIQEERARKAGIWKTLGTVLGTAAGFIPGVGQAFRPLLQAGGATLGNLLGGAGMQESPGEILAGYGGYQQILGLESYQKIMKDLIDKINITGQGGSDMLNLGKLSEIMSIP